MKLKDLLDEYIKLNVKKSGFLMTNSKCLYLYDNLCCQSECLRLILKSNSHEVDAQYSDDFMVICTDAKTTVFCGLRRVPDLSELILQYRITLSDSELYGTFTGGNELPAADIRYTDKRVATLINYLMSVRNSKNTITSKEIQMLEQAISTDELQAICELYSMGKTIEQNTNLY